MPRLEPCPIPRRERPPALVTTRRLPSRPLSGHLRVPVSLCLSQTPCLPRVPSSFLLSETRKWV